MAKQSVNRKSTSANDIVRSSVKETVARFSVIYHSCRHDEIVTMKMEFKSQLQNKVVRSTLIEIINNPWLMNGCRFQTIAKTNLEKIIHFWKAAVTLLCLDVKYKDVRDALIDFLEAQTFFHFNLTAYTGAIEALSVKACDEKVYRCLSSIALSRSYLAPEAIEALGLNGEH